MPNRFGAGCNCCCTTFTDNFNRSDSTDLGSDWTEAAGDASISGNALALDGSDLVICQTVFEEDNQHVKCDASLDDDESVSVVLNYTASEYHYIKFTLDVSGATHVFTVEFYNSSSGLIDTETINTSRTTGGTHVYELNCCLNGGYLSCTVEDGQSAASAAATAVSGGTKTGLKAETSTVSVDDFSATDCGCTFTPVCGCDANGIPNQLQVEISASFGGTVHCTAAECDGIFDGTHILERDEEATGCRYRKDVVSGQDVCSVGDAIVENAWITAQLLVESSKTTLRVSLFVEKPAGGANEGYYYKKVYGFTNEDCTAISGVALSYETADSALFCTNASSTSITATAL